MTVQEDARDEERFRFVTTEFARELARESEAADLKISKSAPKPDRVSDGWYRKIAAWPRKARPGANGLSITAYLCRYSHDEGRTFWFGFESDRREPIDDLVSEIGATFQPRYEFDHDPDQREYDDAVRQNAGQGKYCGPTWGFYFGKYEIGFTAQSDRDLANQAAEYILRVIEAYDPASAERRDIQEIDQQKGLSDTERDALIKARRGQGPFRRELISYWNGCAVSGCKTVEVLRASHIKPWRASRSNPRERLDPHNGLLLTATLDCLFDRYLISFDDEGRMLVSSRITGEEAERLGLSAGLRLRKKPSREQANYLAEHRKLMLSGER